MRVAGARVLLTGASGGLGTELARHLSAQGAQLVLSGRGGERLSALADELGAMALPADLALAQEVQRLAAQAGEVDILIANAALPATGHLLELSQAQIDVLLAVNLLAPIRLTRAMAEGMAARGRGHIVLISSLAGKAASPLSSLYSASKFGMRGFAHSARMDLSQHGIGVSVILPGFVRDAGMFADTGLKLPRGVGTSSPQQVSTAVLHAIEHNRTELVVAPLAMRAGANVAALAPALSAAIQKLAGARRMAVNMAARQAGKRPPGAPD
ncbi:MAG: SDR family NAD(P)-dependent oxidoreductase [Solirubrobacteraceae bacterium]